MTDSRLRSLERSFTATGDPQAHADLLLERMRTSKGLLEIPCSVCKGSGAGALGLSRIVFSAVGECSSCSGDGQGYLDWEARLELAAHVGSPAARLLVPQKPMGQGQRDYSWEAWDSQMLVKWLGPIKEGPYVVLLRAALAAARAALPVFETDPGFQHHQSNCLWRAQGGSEFGCTCVGDNRDFRLKWTIEAGEKWCDDPSPSRLASWERLANEITMFGFPWLISPEPGNSAFYVDRIQYCAHSVGGAPVREAICAAISTWVLQ